MIKTLIVDDEPLAHKVLANYCDKIDYIKVVGNCFDGMSTINFLEKTHVDLILLDIQMPDLTGLQVLESLQKSPKVIFTTAFSQYAIDSYNFEQVVDYLLKPVALPRFIKAIQKVRKNIELEKRVENDEIKESEIERISTHIKLKDNGTLFRISLDEISHIQSWGNYIKLHLVNNDVKLFRMTFKQLQTLLPEKDFVRIHKSYIANIEHVRSLKKNQVVLEQTILPIGKSYSMMVKKIMG